MIHYCPSNPCPFCHPPIQPINAYYPIPDMITDPKSEIKTDSVRINTDDLSSLVNQNKDLRSKIEEQSLEILSLKEKNKKLAEKLGRVKEILK
jgi:hypothetical protein